MLHSGHSVRLGPTMGPSPLINNAPAPPRIQMLVDLARKSFQTSPLNPSDSPDTIAKLEELRLLLKSVPLSELGITDKSKKKLKDNSATYIHIYEDTVFSLGIFCLPAGSAIPLHDHPHMSVLTRVLYGQLEVDSYDWKDGKGSRPGTVEESQNGGREVVHVLDSQQVGPDNCPLVLLPNGGGNIHSFKAITHCAVLDLIVPPYDAQNGRGCTYYTKRQDADGRILMQKLVPEPTVEIDNRPYGGVVVK
jgi:predicted metal-dependent enzyme (double-stranded beta helix superfamily)